jgi:hypothetical protein
VHLLARHRRRVVHVDRAGQAEPGEQGLVRVMATMQRRPEPARPPRGPPVRLLPVSPGPLKPALGSLVKSVPSGCCGVRAPRADAHPRLGVKDPPIAFSPFPDAENVNLHDTSHRPRNRLRAPLRSLERPSS